MTKPEIILAAKAVIDFDVHTLVSNTAETGEYLCGHLEDFKARHTLIGNVRGMRLMQAIELVEDRESKAPATEAPPLSWSPRALRLGASLKHVSQARLAGTAR